jgi:hypothetical protein
MTNHTHSRRGYPHSDVSWRRFLRTLWSDRGDRSGRRFIPTVCSLEDRSVPATLGAFQAVPYDASLVYEADGSGQLPPGPVPSTDTLAFSVGRGETITAVVDGAATLQPAIQLLDPDGNVVGSATASGAGGEALIQSVLTPGRLYSSGSPVTYRLQVSGVGASPGDYTVRVLRNAAVEQRVGDAAQSLDPAFIRLHPAGSDADAPPDRAAVLGNLAGGGLPVGSGEVSEKEINNPPPPGKYDFAQNLDGAGWNLRDNANITESTTLPHISVNGVGDGTFDYYSVTISNAGDRAIFDIDNENFDTMIFLYDSAANLLDFNDDAGSPVGQDDVPVFDDPGDGSSSASYLAHTFAAPGTYTIAVGKFFSTDNGGQLDGTPPEDGDAYTLQVSVQNHTLNADGADPIVEHEPNDPSVPRTLDYTQFAQDIDTASWVVNNDPNFTDPQTVPHLTVHGTGDGTFDYYSFIVPADDSPVNIGLSSSPATGSYPAQVFLFDLAGNPLGTVSASASGSFTLPAGTYVLAVGTSVSQNSGGLLTGIAPQTGDTYDLNVSVAGHDNVSAIPESDLYSFQLGAGESASVVVTALSAGASAQVAIVDANGNVLAGGDFGTASFVAPTAGTYFVRVSSTSGQTAYNLVVGRNVTLDTGTNNSIMTAQDLLGPSVDGQQFAAGAVDTASSDYYRITADGHDKVKIRAQGQDDANLTIRLYDSSGRLVASSHGFCGRDELTYRVPKGNGGDYYVELAVSPSRWHGAKAGGYVLSIHGNRND